MSKFYILETGLHTTSAWIPIHC